MFVIGSIIHRRLRSWLTILGIVVGIATIVSLISVSEGMENAIRDQFSQMGVSSIRIVPANLRGPPTGDLGLRTRDAEYIRSMKEVEYVNELLFNFAPANYNNREETLMVMAYDTKLASKGFADLDLELESGRLFAIGEKDGAILGYNTAYDAFDKEIHPKNSLLIKGEKFKVIGVFKRTGTDIDNRLYIPLESARLLFEKPDIVNSMVVKIKPGIEIEGAQQRIDERLSRIVDEDSYEIFTPEQLLDQFNTILGVVQSVLSAIAAISLLVGGIGITNAMYTSVLERTRQIGIMKAIGATRRIILGLFLLEASIIGMVGGVIGVMVGMIISYMVEYGAAAAGFSLLKIEVNVFLVFFGLAFACGVGIIAGVLPAFRAARLKPVDALRYE